MDRTQKLAMFLYAMGQYANEPIQPGHLILRRHRGVLELSFLYRLSGMVNGIQSVEMQLIALGGKN